MEPGEVVACDCEEQVRRLKGEQFHVRCHNANDGGGLETSFQPHRDRHVGKGIAVQGDEGIVVGDIGTVQSLCENAPDGDGALGARPTGSSLCAAACRTKENR